MTSVFPWQNEDRLEIHKAKFAKVIMYFFHEGISKKGRNQKNSAHNCFSSIKR